MKTLETLMYAVSFTTGFIFLFCAVGTILGNDSFDMNPYVGTAMAMFTMNIGYTGFKRKGIIRGIKTPGTRKAFAVLLLIVDLALLAGCVHEAVVQPSEQVIVYVAVCIIYLVYLCEAVWMIRKKESNGG